MSEEELDEIVKLRDNYRLADRYTKQWLDFTYDKNRTKYSDDYYDIKINKSFDKEIELTIHLPTIVAAMEKYRDELYAQYQKKLSEK